MKFEKRPGENSLTSIVMANLGDVHDSGGINSVLNFFDTRGGEFFEFGALWLSVQFPNANSVG